MTPEKFFPTSSPRPSNAGLLEQPSAGHANPLVPADAGLFGVGPRGSHSLAELLARPARAPEALLSSSMPDPFVLTLSATSPGGARTAGLWLIATSSNRPHAFPLYRWSTEHARFEPAMKDGRQVTLFPEGQLPQWWNQGEPVPTEPGLPRDLLLARWAPEVFELGDQLVLFYTARDRQGILRSAYATSRCIEGPWTDHGALDVNPRVKELVPDYPGGPAGENPVLGTIDGTVVSLGADATGRQRMALVVKVDGNALRWVDETTGRWREAPTPLVAREFTLDADGTLRFVGTPNVILTNGPQHGGLVEGQFFVRENGHLYVLYSAGFFGNHEYRTYVGRLDDVMHGRIWNERLLMDSESPALRGAWNGPGHPSLEKVGDGLYALYLHAWRQGTDYNRHGEQRQALRFHVSFRDAEGRPCAPFVIEDLQVARAPSVESEAA